MTNRFHLSLDNWGTRLIALGMFLYLATNTWQFISQFIPNDTPWHRPVMFVFFEGGLVYWFNRLEHASENVAKTIIAAFMTLVQLSAVAFATVYELSLELQKQMGIHMDNTIHALFPFVVTGLILLWVIMWALGRISNEHFARRIGHIARTGYSPHVTGDLSTLSLPPGLSTEPLALGAPKSARVPHQRAGIGQRIASSWNNWFAGLKGQPKDLATDESENEVIVTEEPADELQENVQEDAQESGAAGNNAGRLDIIEQAMFQALMSASPQEQATLREYAEKHSTEEAVAYLQSQYPKYSAYFNADRVRHVMSAYVKAKWAETREALQPAEERAEMYQSAAPRSTAPRRKTTKKTSSAGTRNRANLAALLPLLEKEYPGLTDAALAKIAGCSASTVNRWRAEQGVRA